MADNINVPGVATPNEGHQFLSGTTIGLELLKGIKTEEAALAKYLLHVNACLEDTDTNLLKAHDAVAKIGDRLTSIISRIEKIEKEYTGLARHVSEIDQKQKHIEKRVDNTNEKLEDLKVDFNELETNMENVGLECSTSAKVLTSLTERVSNIEHYRSLNRPDRIFFHTPARNKYFMGRNTELRYLENSLCMKKTTATQFVSGLGGSGKTTFAIEFSWLMHKYYKGGLFWISAESNATFENSLSKLALDAETIGKKLTRNTFSNTKMAFKSFIKMVISG